MNLKSHATIAANPDLAFAARLQPIRVEFGGEAALEIATGVIRAEIAEIPVAFTIPFMAPHRRRVVAAALGPFGVRIEPANATIRAFGMRIGGVFGADGISGELTALGKCRLEIELAGEIPGRIVKAALEGTFEE